VTSFLVAEPIYCDALRNALEGVDPIRIVGAASDASSALTGIRQTRPKIALVHLPAPEGPQFAQSLRVIDPLVTVVAFGVRLDAQEVLSWAQAGVNGCVDRNETLDELLATVNAAAGGSTRCSAALASMLFSSAARSTSRLEERLTERERDVLELLQADMPNKQIAATLHLSVSTVKTHVRSVFAKLGVHRRADVVGGHNAVHLRAAEVKR
jgi:two-component system nitrate/nitrite response regulator NarL